MAETTTTGVLANPAPLGLMAFGMTTVLLNLYNAGILGGSLGMIMGMGIFYGGLAQVIAGAMEFKKGNTFGTTAFLSYGFFWLSLVAILMLPGLGLAEAVPADAMAAYLAMWGIFTTYMYIGTLKLSKSLQVVFLTLAILFFLLAIADATGSQLMKTIAGYEGIICGFSAIYAAMGLVLNDVYKKTVVPL